MDVNNIFIDRDKNLESFLTIYPRKLRRGRLRRMLKKGIGYICGEILDRDRHEITTIWDDFDGSKLPNTMTIFYLFPFLKKFETHIVSDAVCWYAEKRAESIVVNKYIKDPMILVDYAIIGNSIAIEMRIEEA